MRLARQGMSQRLVLLCSVAYFCSYLTRINYAAVMVEIIAREGISRIEASAAHNAKQVIVCCFARAKPPRAD